MIHFVRIKKVILINICLHGKRYIFVENGFMDESLFINIDDLEFEVQTLKNHHK